MDKTEKVMTNPKIQLRETEDAVYGGWPSRAYLHAAQLAHLMLEKHPELREA